MKLKFFDANLQVGLPTRQVYGPIHDRPALLRHLAGTGIARALVWHVAQHDVFPAEGNRLLNETIAGQVNLWGCWTVLPPSTGEVVTRDFFQQMRRHRVVALRAFPQRHNYLLNRTSFGKFLDEVVRRRIPLMLAILNGIPWQTVFDLLKEYPKLTCILCQVGVWNPSRCLWPLLETYPNVRAETSMVSLHAGMLEEGVQRYGVQRFVFGTNFPTLYAEAAMLQLQHAEISESDQARIASGNLERLIEQIRW